MFLRALCINVARLGLSCGGSLRPLLAAWNIDLVALSEADVTYDSGPSWIREWKAAGWHACLSAPGDSGVSRVALLSRLPFKVVQLCSGEGLGRQAAALIDVATPRGTDTLLCVAAYFQSGQKAVAEAQFQDVIAEADYSGRSTLIFGDFNLTQQEGLVAEVVQSGLAFACDDAARGEELPCTGPVRDGRRRRRIDYGLTLHGLVATEVLRVPEAEVGALSDHLAVVYQFDATAPEMLSGVPRRRSRLPEPCPDDFHFPAEVEAHFQELLQQGVDEAWTFASDWAERLLFEEPRDDQVPRSEMWSPGRPRRRRDNDRELDQSPGLRALRRLVRKLQLCVHRPWDVPLQRACIASCIATRSLVPELPRLACGSTEAVQQVEGLVTEVAKREKQLHLSHWKERMQFDVGKVRAYVKRKADEQLAFEQEPPALADTSGGWHPAVAVHEQAKLWEQVWTAGEPPDLEQVDRVLRAVARPPEVPVTFAVGAEELRCATLAMKHKAAGADDWLPCDLAALPRAWFDWAALIWDRILAQGRVPSLWRRAKVALLWKSRRGTRPITLLNAIWRAGARVIQAQLRPWVQSWCDHRSAGGIAGTSVQQALMQIRKAMADEATCFAQLDITAYFDSIQLPVLKRALQHLRFPPVVLAVLLDFYTGAERVFSMAGVHTSCWAAVDCGIAQGCPLSPVLASALSHIWASYVASDMHARQVGALAYIDDRTLWLCKGQPLSCLQAALERSADFDHAFCFKLSLAKCALVPRFPASEHRTLAEELGFQVAEDLEVLGVRAPFQGPWSLLRFQVRKVVLRARLLSWVTSNRKIQKHLILSLVVPPFAWAAGFARPDAKALKEIRTEITQAFQKCFSRDFARVCFFEALDWQLHPEFACDLVALRVLWKANIQVPGWLDFLPMCEARFRWQALIPEAPDVLRRLGWTMDFAGSELQRRDRAGRLRVVRPGFDGFQVVFQRLRQHYRQRMVAQTGRVKHRYHRDEPSLAAGLDLPAQVMDALPLRWVAFCLAHGPSSHRPRRHRGRPLVLVL